MKFITYQDEFGNTHYFDASRVMFTMTQPTGSPNDDGSFDSYLTKVALNENMGFIIADEAPESIVSRIKEANGL